MTRTLHPRRGGFTLIEVLVAAGLSMLIMALVTQMFARGIDTLSELKSVTELSQRLRAFEGMMRNDLAADHFEGRNGARVGDYPLPRSQAFSASATAKADWRSPTKGFFSIRQEMNANYGLSTREGMDSDGNVSTRATGHILHMTVKRTATRGDKVFTTQLPTAVLASVSALNGMNLTQMANQSNAFTSSWAEVVYFLDTTDTSMGQTPGGTPLFGLYRRVRVIPEFPAPQLPVNNGLNNGWRPVLSSMTNAADHAACQGLSFSPRNVGGKDHYLNDPASIRNPMDRLGGITAARSGGSNANFFDRITRELDNTGPGGTAGAPTGSDLLLCDVLSFEIKADWDFDTSDVPSQRYLRPGTPGNNPTMFPQFDLSKTFEFPFSDLPLATILPVGMVPPTMNPRNTLIGATRAFDTWYETTGANSWTAEGHRDALPLPIRLRAVQIKVRVWDRHNNMARQVTIIQDL